MGSLSANAAAGINNADALLTAALGGMGVVLFPIGWSMKPWGAGRLVQLMPHYSAAIGSSPSPVSAIHHARHPSLNVRAVIDYFIDVFGTLYTGSAKPFYALKLS